MAKTLSEDEKKEQIGRTWNSEQPDLRETAKSPSINIPTVSSALSLNSTDPGDESAGSRSKRRYSEISWEDALQAQALTAKLQTVCEELEQALPPIDLRDLKPKPCLLLMNTRKSSLRLKRGQTFT